MRRRYVNGELTTPRWRESVVRECVKERERERERERKREKERERERESHAHMYIMRIYTFSSIKP